MFRFAIALLLLPLLGTSALAAKADHEVRLRDGSVLQGRVLGLDGAQLLLSTAFQDSLRIPRAQVVAIFFVPFASNPTPPPAAAANGAAAATEEPAGGTGHVELAIQGDQIRTSARYRSDAERARAKDLNTILLRIYADGKLVLTRSDDTMEKDANKGNWRYLRNSHQFEAVAFDLPAGKHEIQVVVGNRLELLEADERQAELVSAELILKDIRVRENETTRIAIKGKGSRFKYGKFELELLSSR